jgi:hypothetical protein
MMNLELARIVIEERRRRTDENLRQAGFRLALTDRDEPPMPVDNGPAGGASTCNEKAQRTKPALG